MEPTAKERILKKIRKALIHSAPQPFPNVDSTGSIYPAAGEELEVIFATEFSKLSGNFIFCENTKEFIENLSGLCEEKGWTHLYCWESELQQLFQEQNFDKCRIGKNLDKANAGITSCEFLVARIGGILLSSKQGSGRALSIFPPVHLVVAYTSQLVYDIKEGLQGVMEKYEGSLPSMINLATGPSRTADIEKTLVLGAHGPKEVFVFLIDDKS